MFFKVKLSLIVDAVLPSVIALQQSRPRQSQQALAEHRTGFPLVLFSVNPAVFLRYIYTQTCIS